MVHRKGAVFKLVAGAGTLAVNKSAVLSLATGKGDSAAIKKHHSASQYFINYFFNGIINGFGILGRYTVRI